MYLVADFHLYSSCDAFRFSVQLHVYPVIIAGFQLPVACTDFPTSIVLVKPFIVFSTNCTKIRTEEKVLVQIEKDTLQ